MSFSGIHVERLRSLARHIDLEVAPLLRRNATVTLETLAAQDLHALGDRSSSVIMSVASWLDEAAADLLRRASIVESAERLDVWAATMPAAVRLLATAEADAVTSGLYTAHSDADIADWIARQGIGRATEVVLLIRSAIEDGDVMTLGRISEHLEMATEAPWFDAAMASVFAELGPGGAALLVRRLVAVPEQHYDDATMLRYASAFSAATRAGLSWEAADVRSWFEHGPAGAAQLLRAPGLDPRFLELVVTEIGFGEYTYVGAEPIPGIRHSLSNGSDMWTHVGTRAGDHRSVLLDALAEHPALAVATLAGPGTIEQLVAAPWHLDGGIALGDLLVRIDRAGRASSRNATGEIRHRAIRAAARGAVEIPREMRPALAELVSHHLGDLAFSLALSDEMALPGSRLDLPASDIRKLLRSIAEHDAALSTLTIAYGVWVAGEISHDGSEDFEQRLGSVADEIGALTFALAYADRDVRVDRSQHEVDKRLSALHVLEFLAWSGVGVLPGPAESGAGFAMERILRTIKSDLGEALPDALMEHNAWKERMLADLEYLIAVEMNDGGLLDRRIDRTGLSRLEFLYLVEEVDGPLELIMTIIEAQARRQREALEATT